MRIESLHHVSLTVRDLETSRRFYAEVLGLREIERPGFPFAGAWFAVGESQHLHLIHDPAAYVRQSAIDTKDNHFAVRVASYRAAVEHFAAVGYSGGKIHLNPNAIAGFPQMYIVDPDNHVIEINAERLD